MPRAATVKESFPIIRYHPRLELAMGYLTVLIVRRDLHAIIALLSFVYSATGFYPSFIIVSTLRSISPGSSFSLV